MDLTASASRRRRSMYLVLNAVVFAVCYPLANLLAQGGAGRRNVMLALDGAVPFLPWMVIPYLSSGLIFIASFYLVRSIDEVRVLSARLLMATACASLVFVLWPFQFSLPTPAVDAPLAPLFAYLALVDKPYNQLPSLHVAYCVIFWFSLRAWTRHWLARASMAVWLALVAASTVLIRQHHLLDVAGGVALGAACVALVKPGRREMRVAFHYLVAATLALFAGVASGYPLPFAYIAASLVLVALAYARDDRDFLRKRGGRIPLRSWLLYSPYLLLYRLTWLGVRLRERRRAPVKCMAPRLWVGRRLSAREAARLPADCAVIDLANELSETPALRRHRYRHFPLLDLRTPPPEAIEAIAAALAAELAAGRVVYLHCAMGYSRCIFIAKYYTEKEGHGVFDLPAETPLPAIAASLD